MYGADSGVYDAAQECMACLVNKFFIPRAVHTAHCDNYNYSVAVQIAVKTMFHFFDSTLIVIPEPPDKLMDGGLFSFSRERVAVVEVVVVEVQLEEKADGGSSSNLSLLIH